jgi:PAS domain S-box-containing protein
MASNVIIENISDSLILTDTHGIIKKVNKLTINLLKFKKEELLNNPIESFLFSDEDHIIFNDYFKLLLLQQNFYQPYNIEISLLARNGLRIIASLLGLVLKDKNNSIIGILFIARNISEKRKSEDKLRKSEEQFKTLFKEGPIPTFAFQKIEKDFILVDYNKAAVEFTGGDIKKLLGIKATKMYHEYPEILNYLNSCYLEKAKRSIEYEYPITFANQLKHLLVKNTYIPPDLVLVHTEDITKRKEAEKKIKKYSDKLEELVKERTNQLEVTLKDLKRSNQELQQFAYVVSHDLQEPLRMVTSFMSLLQKRYSDKLDQNANDFIYFAVDGAKRMQELIKAVLKFSRVGTRGKEFMPTDMNIVLSDVKLNLARLIEDINASITNDPLPVIYADKSQMIQLFQNLISNGIKFHNEKYPKIHISTKLIESDWIFSVKDNGIGIDSKNFNRLFVIFQRLHKKNEYKGTGIGLAICKRIVERHKGKIWVESELGKGSIFYFSIPSNKDHKKNKKIKK